ncbi:hypothetical protein OF83DRAFT_1088201 [Amylostereum chailletii]|nr:hypothetical protein OF83DRAFT_1088201 [Amylostereum chailletii]
MSQYVLLLAFLHLQVQIHRPAALLNPTIQTSKLSAAPTAATAARPPKQRHSPLHDHPRRFGMSIVELPKHSAAARVYGRGGCVIGTFVLGMLELMAGILASGKDSWLEPRRRGQLVAGSSSSEGSSAGRFSLTSMAPKIFCSASSYSDGSSHPSGGADTISNQSSSPAFRSGKSLT